MSRTLRFWSLMLSLAVAAGAHAEPHFVDGKTFDAIAHELSGEDAQELDRRIVAYHRIQGSPMMADVAESVVVPALKAAGVETTIERFPADGKTRYQAYLSPLAWKIREGELWVEGDRPERICRYADVPMCVSTYAKGGRFSGELVDVGRGTRDADYEGKSLAGKVVPASGYAADVVRRAVIARGAVGAVIYPAADDRPDHPYMVRYNGVWPHADELEKTRGSFQISAAQYARLKARMTRGPVRVRGNIDATLGPGSLTVVHAYIRGADRREVVLTAHLDHPKWSANDNASGSADLVEIARTLATLIARKQLPAPRHTLHFMWVPEFHGTAAYLTRHPEARACHAWDDPRRPAPATSCVLANLNLDMVGEDTVKTNSRFYMTRSPASVPSFLDALLPDVLEQTRAAELFAPTGTRNYWPAEMAGPTGGSDHELFLGIGVPATMLGHDPDWTHHTSEDTPDKTDASELLRVGVVAATAAWFVAMADDAAWLRLAPAVAAEALRADGARLVAMRLAGDARLAGLVERRLAATAAHLADARLAADGSPIAPGAPGAATASSTEVATGSGPHRLVIPPVDGDTFRRLAGADRAWYEAEREKTDDLAEAMTETINLMNGRRSTAELADALSLSLGRPVAPAWVERVVAVLSGLGLVRVSGAADAAAR
jgi:hypothetical protein